MKQFSILILLVIFRVDRVQLAREINNLLINDLNIIATKLDDIPITTLNVQLVLLAYNCRDLLITWSIVNTTMAESMTTTTAATTVATTTPNNGLYYTTTTASATTQQPVVTENSKVFGYQIVVKEFLNLNEDNEDMPEKLKKLNKTMRLYTSKYIDVGSRQNKFKLKNLLFNNLANYYICLVIYFDVVETVAFEKQCVHFNLPYSLYKNNKACANVSSTTQTMISTSRTLSPFANDGDSDDDDDNENSNAQSTSSVHETKVNSIDYTDDTTDENSVGHLQVTPPAQTEAVQPAGKSSNLSAICTEYATEVNNECSQYSKLMIAFVVCIALLAMNIFMFSLIIMHIVTKCLIMRKRRRQLHSATNETILESRVHANANRQQNHHHQLKPNSSSVLLSVSQVNANKQQRPLTSSYHQTHNICCMYDTCYKTDFTNYAKPKLEPQKQQQQEPKRRSKSTGFLSRVSSFCYSCYDPDIDEFASRMAIRRRGRSKYYEQEQEAMAPKRKNIIQKSNDSKTRPGYILQVPNTGVTPAPTSPQPSTITSNSTMSSFDKIRKLRRLNLFSAHRAQSRKRIDPYQQQMEQQQQQQKQMYFNNYNNPQFYQHQRRMQFNNLNNMIYNRREMFDEEDSIDSEIFYHYPSKQLGPQMSSAF